MLDNQDNILEFEIKDNDYLHLKYFIKNDLNGNGLGCLVLGHWKQVEMPKLSFRKDIVAIDCNMGAFVFDLPVSIRRGLLFSAPYLQI